MSKVFIVIKKNVFSFVVSLLWGVLALVSVNHLAPFSDLLLISTKTAGFLAWAAFALTLCRLGQQYWKELLVVFLLFFSVGWLVGPFLEPPGDPLDHLAASYAMCGKTLHEIPQKTNEGLWQYSMVSNILCHERYSLSPGKVLQRIDLVNGLLFGGGASTLLVVALRAGFRVHWAFFSVCLAFLFMGSNRFSYFSYYSLAPSFTSMWIYWLWIACFFFKSEKRNVVPALLVAIMMLPVLIVNHIQEVFFLALICSVWLGNILMTTVVTFFAEKGPLRQNPTWWLFLAAVLVALFIMPQLSVSQELLRQFFVYDRWQEHQQTLLTWKGWYFIGKIWMFRINDTLGAFGFLPILLVPVFMFPKAIAPDFEGQWRVLILGLMPFIIYCVPLVTFIWTSNLPTVEVYYRACYTSLFWLPVSLVLYSLQVHTGVLLEKYLHLKKTMVSGLFFSLGFFFFFLLGSVQSHPLYGKLDFITVDSRKWWGEWMPMIDKVVAWKKEKIETDYITGYLLHAVFDVPLKHNQHSQITYLYVQQIPKRSIEAMVQESVADDRTGCLINLHGFQPTWVPYITDHWSPYWSRPDLFYKINVRGKKQISDYLRGQSVGKCYVYF